MVAEEVSEAEETERRTSYLELFFDLVFVFAITQVTAQILEDMSPVGFARSALMLGLIWWAWSSYTWMTNAVGTETFAARLLILGGAGGSFVMALAVPHAYLEQGAWFGVPYGAVRLLNVALYLWGLRNDPAQLAAIRKLAPWFLVAPAVAVAGGFVDDPARTWLWAASLAIDVVGTLTVGAAGFRVSASHFAERYALFVIIALGESIVAVGAGASNLHRDAAFALTVALAFVGVAALWWAYFDFTVHAAERSLQAAPPERRGPFARDVFTFFHYPIVLGIIFCAVGAKKTLAHPEVPLSQAARVALGLGVAVYLAGFVLTRYRAAGLIAWERLAGGAAALAAALLLDETRAVALLAIVVAILVATIAAETMRLRELRARMRPS